jgi:hypothetical protein
LNEEQRGGRTWFYALAGESAVRAYMTNGGNASDFLATAALVDNVSDEMGTLF